MSSNTRMMPESEKLLTKGRNGANGVIVKKQVVQSTDGNYRYTGERDLFLPASTTSADRVIEPVRLSPAWESVNVPEDELNFRAVKMEDIQMETNPPRDRLNFIWLVFLLHGMGILMPWNMFINARTYFIDYKLSPNYTSENTDYYTKNFMPFMTISSQVPNLLLNWLNVFVQIKGNLTTRIVWSIFFIAIVFILTSGLAMLNTAAIVGTFFWLTIGSVVVINMANGVYQNSIYGMAAKLPPRYTGAVMFGSNLSGAMVALLNMFSENLMSSPRTAAIYYFITALFVLLLCFDTFFALPLNRFYRYHELMNKKAAMTKDHQQMMSNVPYCFILRRCAPQLFNVFFTFFVTLAIFPTMHSEITSNGDLTSIIGDSKNFVNVTCYLTFNIGALIGSYLPSLFLWPKPKYLILLVIARGLFIPFFVLCNYQPHLFERTVPVLFHSDWIYLSGAVVMAITSGYFGSLAMSYVPRCVEQKYAGIAGQLGAAFLISGIVCGLVFAAILPYIVSFPPIF